jgi:hypothetical protein
MRIILLSLCLSQLALADEWPLVQRTETSFVFKDRVSSMMLSLVREGTRLIATISKNDVEMGYRSYWPSRGERSAKSFTILWLWARKIVGDMFDFRYRAWTLMP